MTNTTATKKAKNIVAAIKKNKQHKPKQSLNADQTVIDSWREGLEKWAEDARQAFLKIRLSTTEAAAIVAELLYAEAEDARLIQEIEEEDAEAEE